MRCSRNPSIMKEHGVLTEMAEHALRKDEVIVAGRDPVPVDDVLPGPDKVAILEQRFANEESLFHPKDIRRE